MPVATNASGYVQAGNDVYVVGGFDDASAPDFNNSATQRYDMSTDTWTTARICRLRRPTWLWQSPIRLSMPWAVMTMAAVSLTRLPV